MSKNLRSELEVQSELVQVIVTTLTKLKEGFSVSHSLSDISFFKDTALKPIKEGTLDSSVVVPIITIVSKFSSVTGCEEVKDKVVLIDPLAIRRATASYKLGLLMSCGLTEKGVMQLCQVIADMTQQVVELLDSKGKTTLHVLTPIGRSEARNLYRLGSYV